MRNRKKLYVETLEAKWRFMTLCHAKSGGGGCHDFSAISENFNCDVNTEETYQTFEILINYLASSSCLFQTCVFWISQKIECLTIHSMTEIQILNFILLSLVKYWLSHCLSFYILIPLQIPYYFLKDILFVFWNFHEAQYFTKYLGSITMDSSCTI